MFAAPFWRGREGTMTSPILAEITIDGLRGIIKRLDDASECVQAVTTILESEGYTAHHLMVRYVEDLRLRFNVLWELAIEEFFDARGEEWGAAS